MDSIYADESEQQAIDSLVATWEDEDAPKDEPSDTSEVDDNPENIEEEPTEDLEEDEEGNEGEEQEETPEDDDGDEEEEDNLEDESEEEDPQAVQTVTFKVDGEDKEVSVSDLTRLYGQEAALTRKSQEVAEQRKALEATEKENEAVMEIVLGDVRAEYEKYVGIDWLVAQKRLGDEEFEALREAAVEAEQRFQSVTGEVGKYLKQKEETLQGQLETQAEEAHQKLMDADIGWSKDKLDELSTFAETFGYSKETVMETPDAPLFLLLNTAMQASKVNATVKKKTKTPKKIITSKEKPKAIDPKKGKKDALAKKLRSSGSEEDAMALALSNWS